MKITKSYIENLIDIAQINSYDPDWVRGSRVTWDFDGGKPTRVTLLTYNENGEGDRDELKVLTTEDGLEVAWYREDIGAPTGEDFLPQEWFDLPWAITGYA